MPADQSIPSTPQPVDRLNRWLLRRVGLGMVIATVAIYVLSALIVQHGFDLIERDRIQERLDRAAGALSASAASMVASARDYAGWDETYGFVTLGDTSYLSRNFNDDSTRNLGIDWIVIVGSDNGVIAYLNMRDDPAEQLAHLEFLQKLPAITAQFAADDLDEEGHALLWLAGRPTLVSHAAVTDTVRSRPTAGWLFFGRHMDVHPDPGVQPLSEVPVELVAPSDAERDAPGIRKQGQFWVGRMSLAPWPVALKLQEKPAYSNQKSIVLAWIAFGMVGLIVLTLLGFGAMVHRKVITRLEGFVAHSRQPPASRGIGIRWPVEGNDEIDLLAGTFNNLMERVDESERVLMHLASHDQLTELGNRRHMMKHLQEAVELQRLRPETMTCLVIADIDRFKAINDHYGHSAGDEVLAVVAERIQTLIRADDVAARLGGDEFSVLLAEAGPEHALRFCEKLNERIAHPIPYSGEFLFCTLSIGIAPLGVGMDEHAALFQADQAMYQAKRQGSGRVAVFDATSGNPPVVGHDAPAFPADKRETQEK